MKSGIAGVVANVVAVARRELVTHVKTRTYLVATVCLMVAAALVALAPIAIGASATSAAAT